MEPKILQRIANERRADAVTMIHDAKTGHTGGSMSSLDILTVLYYDVMNVDPKAPRKPDRDRSSSARATRWRATGRSCRTRASSRGAGLAHSPGPGRH